MLTSALAMTASVLFTACKKDEPSSGGGTGNVNKGDVFVVGFEGDVSIENLTAKLWKNGVEQILSDSATAYSVYVSGNDVYVAGVRNSSPVLWKNGKMQVLIGDTTYGWANSVFVSGNDVYVAGYIGGSHYSYGQRISVATLWKNGIVQNLTDGLKYSEAKSVFVSGSDVYVAGLESPTNGYGGARAVLWKNGVTQNLTDRTEHYSKANSVFVYENDVYVVGYLEKDYSKGVGPVWKNGEPLYYWSSQTSNVVAEYIFVSDGDEYVIVDRSLFKNKEYQTLTVPTGLPSYTSSEALSIFVSGSDVYVAGYTDYYGDDWAVVWKNGSPQKLSKTYNRVTVASSVFVVK